MNSAFLGLFSIAWLYLAYRWYGRWIERKVIVPDDKNLTPAYKIGDKVDFHPARPIILFGHHFASIAGAGPIIGPILAVSIFGWGPAVIWILLGVVFLGAVHDYTCLMLSVRHKGSSIPDISGEVISKRARTLFLIFVWLALVLVISVFCSVGTKAVIATPAIVIPTFGLIPLAMIFGWFVYRQRLNVKIGSLLFVGLLFLLIYIGYLYPVNLPIKDSETLFQVWFGIFIIYGLLASTLPVWLLLQPRDYITNWVLIIGMLFGFLGLFISWPKVSAPVFVSITHSQQGPLWPMLFILIACGAISGFHSLVASGTTAKQLAKESQGRLIGYGGMIAEGALAILALLAVIAGLYWTPPPGKEELGLFTLLEQGGPIRAFSVGYGNFVAPIIGLTAGVLFGVTMLKTFVVTTLDTAVRLNRFITTELIGKRLPLFKNRWVASLVCIIPAYILGTTGKWAAIWPVFGASNQLVGSLALIVVSSYLISKGRPSRYTLYPGIFMLITTMAALIWKGYHFLIKPKPNLCLGIISIVLLLLAIYLLLEAVKVIRKLTLKRV
jgi:carbon starvation protein